MLLYTYATPRPVGTGARSLHVGTPAHVCTVYGCPVNNLRAHAGRYTTDIILEMDDHLEHEPTEKGNRSEREKRLTEVGHKSEVRL